MIEDFSQFHNDGGIHIEDAATVYMKGKDIEGSNDTSKHITLQQVSGLIRVPKNTEGDGEVDEYIKKRMTFDLEHKVKRVNKYMDTFQTYWKEATPMEMIIAFDESNGDVDELAMNLTNVDFKVKVQEILKNRLSDEYPQPINQCKQVNVDDDDDGDDGGDYDFIETVPVEEIDRSRTHRHRAPPVSPAEIPPAPPGIDPNTWLTWSEARRSSYLKADSFPNAYYYRHLPPGEKQTNGAWTAHEKAAFLKRVQEFRGDATTMSGDWGMFSLALPGRVGYQCANFYRKLVESGEIYDSQYVKAADGSIHHRSRLHDGKIVTRSSKEKTTTSTKKKAPKHKKIVEPYQIKTLTLVCHTLQEEDMAARKKVRHTMPVLTYHQKEGPTVSRYDAWAMQNPLPNMIDDITGDVIKVPAISPDGYVLDYNTWINTLKSNKENPFTRAPVTKRQLVVLTAENFAEYEDSIVNLNNSAAESSCEGSCFD